jgi:hypothetical protein
MSNPNPRIENGLIGVEKYPFFGMKYEKESPNCCACTVPAINIKIASIPFFLISI